MFSTLTFLVSLASLSYASSSCYSAENSTKHLKILNEIEGWGTGTVGGGDGRIFIVNSLDGNEKSGHQCTLRNAMESKESLWILFEDGLNGDIVLDSTIAPLSYKTIDARGHDITIKVKDKHTNMFKIRDEKQFVFLNLAFDGGHTKWENDDDPGDAISLYGNVKYVWVYHCYFTHLADGAIDMREGDKLTDLPKYITVSRCRYYEIHQANMWHGNKLTWNQNYCEKVNGRCIKIVFGEAHSYNNYIANWDGAEIQTAKSDGRLLAEQNMYSPGDSNAIDKVSEGGEIYWKAEENCIYHTSKLDDTGGQHSNYYESAKADNSKVLDCNKDLRNDLIKNTGRY